MEVSWSNFYTEAVNIVKVTREFINDKIISGDLSREYNINQDRFPDVESILRDSECYNSIVDAIISGPIKCDDMSKIDLSEASRLTLAKHFANEWLVNEYMKVADELSAKGVIDYNQFMIEGKAKRLANDINKITEISYNGSNKYIIMYGRDRFEAGKTFDKNGDTYEVIDIKVSNGQYWMRLKFVDGERRFSVPAEDMTTI